MVYKYIIEQSGEYSLFSAKLELGREEFALKMDGPENNMSGVEMEAEIKLMIIGVSTKVYQNII